MKKYWKTILVLVAMGFLLGACSSKVTHEREVPIVDGEVLLRVYVVRHAQAFKNVLHRTGLSGKKLDSLTSKGVKQAASIGGFLKGKGIAAVVASPTGRTKETAGAVVGSLGLGEYSVDQAFASLRNGKTESGKPASWSWRKRQWEKGRDPRPEGGESLSDGVERAGAAIHELTRKYQGKAVAIVTHGDICAALLGKAQGAPITERHERNDVPTGSVSEILITDKGWFLLRQGVVPMY